MLATDLGCSRSQPAPAPALQARELTIDAAHAPRGDEPLIAGEQVRVGMRIRGGMPPYRVHVEAARLGQLLGANDTVPIELEVTPELAPELARAASDALELALGTHIAAQAPSGLYRLLATVTDARGQVANTDSREWKLIGAGAETVPVAEEPPFVTVLDAGGRRRKSFIRGERVAVRGKLPGARSADIAILDPSGTRLAQVTRPLSEAGELDMILDIPRVARTGAHGIAVRTASGHQVLEYMDIAGAPIVPAQRLVVDALALYGGQDRRTPRAGYLRRGEEIEVELRIGGGARAVTGRLRLHGPSGAVVATSPLGTIAISDTDTAPETRVFLRGSWRVPLTLAPGRHRIEVEATEEEHVSSRYREVLIE